MTMSKKIHVLVANACEARFYETERLGSPMNLISQYTHPESREKGVDLMTDGPGHFKTDGGAHGAYTPDNTPRQLEADRFAHELAQHLHKALANNAFEEVVIVAPAHFYGLINKHCDHQVRNKITHKVEKDYVKMPEKELLAHLGNLGD